MTGAESASTNRAFIGKRCTTTGAAVGEGSSAVGHAGADGNGKACFECARYAFAHTFAHVSGTERLDDEARKVGNGGVDKRGVSAGVRGKDGNRVWCEWGKR